MDRRHFLYVGALGISSSVLGNEAKPFVTYKKRKKIGIIGLDTSHAIAFTKVLNTHSNTKTYGGFHVVAAYPNGSPSIADNAARIVRYSKEIQEYGVEIVHNMEAFLTKVDCVLLETNDGNIHLEQAIPVIQSRKPLFIDKPIANSQEDAIRIFDMASDYKCPVFSSSALRFIPSVQQVNRSQVMGVDIYTPALTDPSHKDLYWYGIHGVEMMFALLGCGCKSVRTISTDDMDVIVGEWDNGRIGTLRAIRNGRQDFGGKIFTQNDILDVGGFNGYESLVKAITTFFHTGKSPVSPHETIEICGFIDAAYESKLKNGVPSELKPY